MGHTRLDYIKSSDGMEDSAELCVEPSERPLTYF